MMRRPRLTAVALVAFVLSGCWGSGVTLGSKDVRQESFSFDEAVARVEAKTGSGDISVTEKRGAETIEVEAKVSGKTTIASAKVDDGTLKLASSCGEGSSLNCGGVSWTVTLPVISDARTYTLETGSGSIAVAGGHGAIEAQTGSGRIELTKTRGTNVTLKTGSGSIKGAFESIDGLDAKTGSGDATIEVPKGDYDLVLKTGSGDETLEGISDQNDASRQLKVKTGSGDLKMIGR